MDSHSAPKKKETLREFCRRWQLDPCDELGYGLGDYDPESVHYNTVMFEGEPLYIFQNKCGNLLGLDDHSRLYSDDQVNAMAEEDE